MYKNNFNILLEYLSIILILSYFLFKNIYVVQIGIAISLYLINIKFFISSIKFIKKFLKSNEEVKIPEKRYIDIIKNNQTISHNKDTSLSLVEEIEELGFIPSLNKKDKSTRARSM